ncbi:hypothetical protein [Ornithinimicrobium panacihumi]|uniref:hypothetical protein n=1 Tax=Ornithinimicrobium panacihumi TaxID=2008449 RepID=UPI003F8C0F9B
MAWDDDSLEVTNDLFGCLPLFLTRATDLLIASDSPVAVVELRRRLGLPNGVDKAATAASGLRNVITAQTTGHRTLARDVEYAGVGSRITLSFHDRSARLEPGHYPTLFPVPNQDYASLLRSVAVDMASLLRTLSRIHPGSVRLNLSGGMDSRITLAAAWLSAETRAAAVYSVARKGAWNDRDSEVVKGLASELVFPLGGRFAAPPSWQHPDALRLWATDSALSYYTLTMQRHGFRAGGYFSVTGHGGETATGNYGLRSFAQIVDSVARLDPEAATGLDEVAGEFLRSAGVDPADPASAEWHYLGVRNALHAGRFVPMTKFGLRPLHDPRLAALNKVPLTERPRGMGEPRQIGADLTMLLSPRLATLPYDKPTKDLRPDEVMDRLAALGGPILPDELMEYRLVGDADQVTQGPSPLIENLLAHRLPEGGLTAEAVRAAWTSALSSIEQQRETLPTNVGSIIRRSQDVLDEPQVRVAHPSGDLGKILSLGILLRE